MLTLQTGLLLRASEDKEKTTTRWGGDGQSELGVWGWEDLVSWAHLESSSRSLPLSGQPWELTPRDQQGSKTQSRLPGLQEGPTSAATQECFFLSFGITATGVPLSPGFVLRDHS